MGRLFDRYVVVDWSAASRPTIGRDSIWIATLDDTPDDASGAPSDAGVDLANPPTRSDAEALLRSIVAGSCRRRTLVAIDAPLGYPAGGSALFGGDDGVAGSEGDPPWRRAWRAIAARSRDDLVNANNRFEVAGELNRRGGFGAGPFWGMPPSHTVAGLEPTKPRPFTPSVAEFRHCEHWLLDRGLRPASPWQLSGAGSVGGQTLTLLPILDRLLDEAGRNAGREPIEVWPFTTGWRAPAVGPGTTVVAETWPTAFDVAYPAGRVRDAAQVHDVAMALRAADDGRLAAWFDRPDAIGAPDGGGIDVDVVSTEGWVLAPAS